MAGFKGAEAFWNSFTEHYARASRDGWFGGGYGREWTEGMYKLLHDVAKEASLSCECRQPHPQQTDTMPGERFHVDFFWYPKGSGRWARPAVVVEHENFEHEAEHDLWKVCQLAAPLRVFIGYARNEAAIPEMWKGLREMMAEHRLAQLSDSETLVMLGDYDKCVSFHAWAAKGDGEFRELPLVRARG